MKHSLRVLLKSDFVLRFTIASLTALGLLSLVSSLQAVPENALAQEVAKAGSEPYWLSYEIDTHRGLGFVCCLDRSPFSLRDRETLQPGTCRPDKKNHSWTTWNDKNADDIDSNRGDRMRVLLRVRKGEVERIRAYSTGCKLDFDHRVEEIQVSQAVSLEFLARLAAQFETKPSAEEELEMVHATIGRHRGPAADRILADLAGNHSSPTEARRSAIFWLGQTRGAFAVKTLRNMLDRETEDELREHIIFSISQTATPDNQGTTELIRLIKETRNPEVRRHALFWLAGSDDPRALDLLAELLS